MSSSAPKKDAEREFLAAYPTLEARYGEAHRHTRKARRYLGELYEAWGKSEIASEYRSGLDDVTR